MCYFYKRGRNESSLFLRSPQKVPSKSWFWVIVWYNPGTRKGPATAFPSSVFILWTDSHVSLVIQHAQFSARNNCSLSLSSQYQGTRGLCLRESNGSVGAQLGFINIRMLLDHTRRRSPGFHSWLHHLLSMRLWPNLETFSASIFFTCPMRMMIPP